MTWEMDKSDGRPCREMPTRACPGAREAGCPDEPCARFEITIERAREIWGIGDSAMSFLRGEEQ